MRISCFVACLLAVPGLALAHFPYIHLDGEGERRALHAYFGHGVEPTDAKYFSRLEGAKVSRVTSDGKIEPLLLSPTKGSLVSKPVDAQPAAYLFEKDQGVISRNGDYLLTNYAKTLSGPEAWSLDTAKQLRLDMTPERDGETVTFTVRWNGRPAANIDVVVELGQEKQEGVTDAQGRFTAKLNKPGIYTVRAWRIDKTPGERNGKVFDDVRYYSTLTLDVE